MAVATPPRPPTPRPDELEALIKEARRRARRRRLLRAAALAAVAAGAAAIYAVVTLAGGGSKTATGVPDGFTPVRARGPVQHLSLETSPSRIVSLDLATGAERPARLSYELWYDNRTKLYRVVDRVDGRASFDVVGRAACSKISARLTFCLPPFPLSELQQAPRWPLDPERARLVGDGAVGGQHVVWVEPLLAGRAVPGNLSERWGLDARTHMPLVLRTTGGPLVQEDVFHVRRNLPARKVTFAVPDGGAPEREFPPLLPRSTRTRPATPRAVRRALGRVPLWLGSSFAGHRLRRVEVGTDGMRAKTGGTLVPVDFARLDYGVLTLEEFARERPWWYRQGPQAGRVVLDNGARAALVRNGLLVVIEWGVDERYPLDAAAALTAARALRPDA